MFSFPIHEKGFIFNEAVSSISILGTIHDHRNRWNPFDVANDLTRSLKPSEWIRWIHLSSKGGRHQDGIYNFRFVINHNPRRLLKLSHWISPIPTHNEVNVIGAQLSDSSLGRQSRNLTIHVRQDCEACFVVDTISNHLRIECSQPGFITPVEKITSVELNGFVWDSLDMFEKFNERYPGREMKALSDVIWEERIPLTVTGGIDFRADGVYQFLLSVNGDEDQGYGAINYSRSDKSSIDLVQGTGFGSSHGTSYHSALTAKVLNDDTYIFTASLQPGRESLSIRGENGGQAVLVNNNTYGIQLLGDVHPENGFDPTLPQGQMNGLDANGEVFEKILSLDQGSYSINFAIGGELFLDTMGLGCWLETSGSKISGIGWHGKPNESNIGFKVQRSGDYLFTYERSTDIFSIEAISALGQHNCCLTAVTEIRDISLVGNFQPPLVAWDTAADQNLMTPLGRGRFEKLVELNKEITYQFKFVGNQTNWQIVFADYELDGYGQSYTTNNPDPYNSKLSTLRDCGHLTTHGNPPPIQFTPSLTGSYLFMVDLWSGAYGFRLV